MYTKIRIFNLSSSKILMLSCLQFFIFTTVSFAESVDLIQKNSSRIQHQHCTLVENGDFEQGNTGFTSGLSLEQSTCNNGAYSISSQFSEKCPGIFAPVFDHTIGNSTGHLMAIDGHSSQATNIWSTQINVEASKNYKFSFWCNSPLGAQNNTSSAKPSFNLIVDGNIVGSIPSNATLDDTWVEHIAWWTASNNSLVEITIQQTNSGSSGHDYIVDDVFFGVPCDVPVFQQSCGESNDELFSDIVTTTDGGTISVGYINNPSGNVGTDIYVVKMNQNGQEEWAYSYGGDHDENAHSIIQTTDGGYFIAGTTKSINNRRDVYALRIDALGQVIWSNIFEVSDNGGISARGVESADGNFFMTGTIYNYGGCYITKVDPNGNLLWSKVYRGNNSFWSTDIIATSDGGCLFNGSTASFPRFGYHDGFLIKINNQGNIAWSKRLGTTFNEGARSVVEATNGDILVVSDIGNSTGFEPSSRGTYLARLTATGDLLWTKTYWGGGHDFVSSIKKTLDNGFILSGSTTSFSTDNTLDVFLIKVNDIGNIVWSKIYGGTGEDRAYNLATTNTGYVVVGYSDSFGDGSRDLYKLSIDSEGNLADDCNVTSVSFTETDETLSITNFTFDISDINLSTPITTVKRDYTPPCSMDCADGLPLRFIVNQTCGEIGDIVQIPITTQAFTAINGFQYSVHIDPSFATIIGVGGFGLNNWSAGDFTIDTNNGTVTVTRQANDVNAGESVPNDTQLFYIEVELIANPGSNSVAYIDGNPTPVVVAQDLEQVVPELVDGELCTFDYADISGNIYTWFDNAPIYDVTVTGVESTNSYVSNSDNLGYYELLNLIIGNDIEVTPTKNNYPDNGVNIFDVIATQQHTLGQVLFTSPYQWIAGDANGDGQVSMVDLVFIKQVIRLEVPNFPMGQSWRFVPADHTLSTSGYPAPFPESKLYNPLISDMVNEDFIGVKVGDVTGDADPSL